MNETSQRHLCVVMHDVAPARWIGCRRVLRQVEAIEQRLGECVPLTLLVVPCWHGDPSLPRRYLDWLHQQVANGHQLALHGRTHLDERAVSGWRQYLTRRVFTNGEGEFAALLRAEAARRLRAGRAWAFRHQLPVQGFVAPAWLLSAQAWQALAESGFDHTCTSSRLVRLPSREAVPMPALMYSSRSAPRRALSLLRNGAVAAVRGGAPLLRLDLHPDDADHDPVLRSWSRWLECALRERSAVRLVDAARLPR